MKPQPLYTLIASSLIAMNNCKASGNAEWFERHKERLDHMRKNYLPSGSGFDTGTFILWNSTDTCLQFTADYHHMDDSGYTGWKQYRIVCRPSLSLGITVDVHGYNGSRPTSDDKDYVAEVFEQCLSEEHLPTLRFYGEQVDTETV